MPDVILRPAVRILSRQRLREIRYGTLEEQHEAKMRWIEDSRVREHIAENTADANKQHYEVCLLHGRQMNTCIHLNLQVSTEFMRLCLGPNAKYSSGLYPTGRECLEEAEVLMLEKYCKEAQLKDGQDILDLGCGSFIFSVRFFMTLYELNCQDGVVSRFTLQR